MNLSSLFQIMSFPIRWWALVHGKPESRPTKPPYMWATMVGLPLPPKSIFSEEDCNVASEKITEDLELHDHANIAKLYMVHLYFSILHFS